MFSESLLRWDPLFGEGGLHDPRIVVLMADLEGLCSMLNLLVVFYRAFLGWDNSRVTFFWLAGASIS